MKDPMFLLQAGDYMKSEKLACSFSCYPSIITPFERIRNVSPDYRLSVVPVGTVEFVTEWCDHMGLSIPTSLSYPAQFLTYLDREVRPGCFWEGSAHDFVKPREKVKAFTGSIKRKISQTVDPYEPVWISEPVSFQSEFRFYIQDFVNGPKVLGWARYDDLNVVNPEPDLNLVEFIMEKYHDDLGPTAYSIDIGWRPDLQRYSLVEINDAWALGLYENTDPQSNPPTRQQYADMLVSRWSQLLFCNIV